MRKALVVFNRKFAINWMEIDIDRDLLLIKKYGDRVPVLCIDEQEVCHYFFDEPALFNYLNLSDNTN